MPRYQRTGLALSDRRSIAGYAARLASRSSPPSTPAAMAQSRRLGQRSAELIARRNDRSVDSDDAAMGVGQLALGIATRGNNDRGEGAAVRRGLGMLGNASGGLSHRLRRRGDDKKTLIGTTADEHGKRVAAVDESVARHLAFQRPARRTASVAERSYRHRAACCARRGRRAAGSQAIGRTHRGSCLRRRRRRGHAGRWSAPPHRDAGGRRARPAGRRRGPEPMRSYARKYRATAAPPRRIRRASPERPAARAGTDAASATQ